MKTFFFSVHGRMTRGPFWMGHLILFAALLGTWAICGCLALLFPKTTDSSADLALTVALGLAEFGLFFGSIVASVWAGICLGIKRYHDHGKPGVWICIQFVPLIGGMWYFVEAFCLEGTWGPNAYGPDPLGRTPFIPPAPPQTAWSNTAQRPSGSAPAAFVSPSPTGRPGWVLPVMFALLIPPALALGAGVVMTARSATWLRDAVHVDGSVVSLKPGTMNDQGHMQYFAIVEGTTPEGVQLHITDGWSTYPAPAVGSPMELAYPPGHPEAAQIVSFVDFWLVPALLDSFALIIIGWLVVILIVKLAWRRAPGFQTPV